jgi:hypothetical protein
VKTQINIKTIKTLNDWKEVLLHAAQNQSTKVNDIEIGDHERTHTQT